MNLSSSPALRILYLEDNPSDAELVALQLKRDGFDIELQRVETRADFESALARPIDLFLADFAVPSFTGLDAIKLLKQRGIDIPIILVSGTIGEEEAVEAMKAGAFDYLLKGKLTRLGVAISNALHEKSLRDQQRSAEKALREAEAKYRAIFENAVMGIFQTTPEGRFISANSALASMFGYDSPQELMSSISDLHRGFYCEPGQREVFKHWLEEHDTISGFESEAYRKDGSTLWISENARAVRDENGRLLYYEGTIENITQRKHAEAALRSSEERYRLLFESNPLPMWIYGTDDLRFLAVNEAAVQHYGYTREEFLNMTIEDIRPSEDIPRLRADLDSPRQGRRQSGPWRHRKKDGTLIDVEILSHNIQSIGPSARLVLANDITERRQAGKALLESERRFRNLFENSPVAYWEEDFSEVKSYLDNLESEGIPDLAAYLSAHPEVVLDCVRLVKIIDVNQAALRMHKAESKQQLLANLEITFTPEAFQAFTRELLAIANGEDSLEMDEVVRTLDGEQRDASVLWSVAPGHEQTYSRVLVSLVDITTRKQAEQSLKLQDEELRRRNAELVRLYRASESLLVGALADLPALAQNIVNTLLREFEQSNCSLLLVNRETRELERIAVAGPYAEQVSRAKLSLDNRGLVAKAVRIRQVINNPDVTADPDYVPNWEAAHSELVIPLKIGEEVIGALDVQSPEPSAFHADDERLMTIFAERAAFGLERTRLHEQTRKQLQRLEGLRTIDLAISNSLDLRISINIVLEQAILQLGVDGACVLLLTPGSAHLEYFAGRGFHARDIEATKLRLGEGLAGKAALEKQIVYAANLSAEDDFTRSKMAVQEEFVCYFGVPLIAKGEVKGVLEIYHRQPLRPDMEWLNFLDALGWQTAIAVDNALLFEGIQRSNLELAMAYDATIEGWSRALDLRDKETEGHTQRVTEKTLKLAEAMGFHAEKLVHIKRGALLHDIGKMGVPDNILLKEDSLTAEEWEIMKRHPGFAYEMLQPIAYLKDALHIPYCHHEKWDGSGYPRGLAGTQIPLEARLFAVVDVWDAITSDRPYRKKWSKQRALQYIRDQVGKHFDPEVVQIFLQEIVREETNLDGVSS